MKDLEKVFVESFNMPSGSCPLPEPGKGAPVIEQPELLDVLPMEGESPDEWVNKEERLRFEEMINKLLKLGKITESEAQMLLTNIRN